MKRPRIVTLLGYLNIIDGIGFASFTLVMFFISKDSFTSVPLTGQIFCLLLILVPLSTGIGILKRKRWAWFLECFFLVLLFYEAGLNFVSGLSLFELSQFDFAGVLKSILLIIFIIAIGILWNRKKVKTYFFQKT